ncbi:MAG: glycosyltransferase family 2 protein [Bacillota bacterium]
MVSIIVVTSDNPEEARLCLKSLAEFTPEEHEVIATQPPFHELDDLVTGQDNIRFVRKECARNPFSVKNRVAAEARGKYLLFMDGSTVVTPRMAHEHAVLYREHGSRNRGTPVQSGSRRRKVQQT